MFHAPERHAILSRSQIARIAFVFVLGAFALGRTLPDAIRVFAPLTVFGYYTDSAGVITSVIPDSAAAKVGLRIGDRVDMHDFAQADRKGGLIGKTYSAYNPQRHLTIVRDGVRMAYEINGVPEGIPTRGVILLRELVAFITILIGMLLAIVRPNRASLGFFHFVIGGEVYPNAMTSIWLDYPWRMIVDGINDVLVAGAAIGLLMFALGFPRDIPVRWRIPVDVVGAIVWLASTALLLSADIGATYFARPAIPEAQIYNGIQSTIYIGAMFVFIVTLIRSRGSDQIRVGAVVGAFLVAIVGYLLAEHLYPGPLKYWEYVALEALPVLPALVVFYGATRYHMMGIDFLVNRALVYAAMMAAVVGIVGLAEEGFSYWFVMNTNLAYAIIIAITLVFGTFFGKIRDAVRLVVDRVLFRDRLFAHDSLDVLAREIPHALDRDRIEYALTSAVQQALSLRCAVLLEQRGDHFTVVADVHWPPSATSIPQDDPALQRVIQQGIAQFLSERDYMPWSPDLKAVAPRVAVPIDVDGGSPFVAIYGLEMSGVDIDPDETRALERLAASAAVGFSNLRTRELAEHLEELINLRTENDQLRARIIELEKNGSVSPLTEAPRSPALE
ncbi:MAG: PDZ domain-containing protein [Vulcanimicrobiaceae bacterium]|jgi:hypothetical protein